MDSNYPDLILGTAGHIDHGKSALVMALTGTDPDRLAEEKRRGITIQLGFAQLTLPDGRTMGVVDVPGHERFVRQMIAGATGIDVALLVIAADDGIMPQTIEHLAVLQTLGVLTCVVALTKIDLVDDEWAAFVADDIRMHLASTPYADAPIVPVSSVTKHGLDQLLFHLQCACETARKIPHGRMTRLPIDRVFGIKGAGTVVTGTLWSGSVAPGDVLEVLPGGKTSRVRTVQVHGHDEPFALPGNRVALNVADLSTRDVAAGDLLAQPGCIELTDRFDCLLMYLDTTGAAKPLATGTRMHIAHGTREVLGRVLICNGLSEIAPGHAAYAQVRLEEPLALCTQDRFVVRTYSPVHVAGGGTVLLAHPRRRTTLKEDEADVLAFLAQDDIASAAVRLVQAQPLPIDAAHVAHTIGTDEEGIADMLEQAVADNRLIAVGTNPHRLYTTQNVKQQLASRIDAALIAFHSGNLAEAGMSTEALRHTCLARMEPTAFGALIDALAQEGAVIVQGGSVGHPSAQGAVRQTLENAAHALSILLAEQALMPEPLGILAQHAALPPSVAGKAAAKLVETGRAYRAAPDLLFDQLAVDNAQAAIAAHLRQGGAGTVAALRDVMGTSRKYALILLERFDADGFTERHGDERSLHAGRQRSSETNTR